MAKKKKAANPDDQQPHGHLDAEEELAAEMVEVSEPKEEKLESDYEKHAKFSKFKGEE